MKVPLYFTPRPYQQLAWQRRFSGQFDTYASIWHRQAGKDTEQIEWGLTNAFINPGTQSVYAGPSNKWLRTNIWNKYLDGRTHFQNFPKDVIDTNATQQLVTMTNNPDDLAPATMQYVGLKESEAMVGSSYDTFLFSELSLYKRASLDYLQPIWDNKRAEGKPLMVSFNFTPRGISNIAADWLKAWTGTDDPEGWPGAHGNVFVDWMPANKSEKAPGVRLYSDEHLEQIRDRYIRLYGNDNLYRQEMLCEFMSVNAGLVYPTIEALRQEGRYTQINLNTGRPVYMAWDISSKGKETDWTSCVVFQYYEGNLRIYDYMEVNRLAVVEAVQELSKRPYFHLIRAAALPWDSDRSGSISSPLEECRRMFPNISWFKLDKIYVNDGISMVRKLLPNTVINSDKCDWMMECFENYEYKTIISMDDFSGQPKHDRYSHLMDAVRYMAQFVNECQYVISNDGNRTSMPVSYEAWNLGYDDGSEWDELPPGMRPSSFSPLRKKSPRDIYGSSLDVI